MGSSYCLSMKQAYESLKKSIEVHCKELNICSDKVFNAIPCMEKIIIDYKQIDNGKMSEFYTSLNTIKTYFEDIIKKCDAQIIYWEEKYQAALLAESTVKASTTTNNNEDINPSGDEVN